MTRAERTHAIADRLFDVRPHATLAVQAKLLEIEGELRALAAEMFTHQQRVAPDTPEGDWMPDTAIAEVESLGFECEAGPITNSEAWRWIKNTMLGLQRITEETE